MSFSIEDEIAAGRGVSKPKRDALDIVEALDMLEAAQDSTDISMALRKVAAKHVLQMIQDDKISGGDVVRILAMTMDRVDGKVADRVDIKGQMTWESVLGDFMDRTAGLPRDDISVIDVDSEVVEE